MDSAEIWWTGWVCDKDEMMIFWRRSGSGDENFKVILHRREMGRKTMDSTISQKAMFEFGRNSVQVGCLPRTN